MLFYFDENLPKQLAEALNCLDKDNEIKSVTNDYRGIKDDKLIETLGEKNAILITRDRRMKRYCSERELLIKYKMKVLFYDSTVSDYWYMAILFVKKWNNITKEFEKIKEGPYFMVMNTNGKIEQISCV